ncbi:hypothetical protein GM708_13705 [Vibrio cholerae]|nr:hypothetical protein [Vibrio cholerae]
MGDDPVHHEGGRPRRGHPVRLPRALALPRIARPGAARHLGRSPPRDPLPWALRDRRSYQVKGTDDVLWIRLLDVVEALSRRSFRGSGRLVLEVSDDLGLVGGSYVLTVVDGVAEVVQVDAATAPDASLSVNALGSLFLGGVTASSLSAAGALTARSEDAVDLLDELFGRPEEPYCITHF